MAAAQTGLGNHIVVPLLQKTLHLSKLRKDGRDTSTFRNQQVWGDVAFTPSLLHIAAGIGYCLEPRQPQESDSLYTKTLRSWRQYARKMMRPRARDVRRFMVHWGFALAVNG